MLFIEGFNCLNFERFLRFNRESHRRNLNTSARLYLKILANNILKIFITFTNKFGFSWYLSGKCFKDRFTNGHIINNLIIFRIIISPKFTRFRKFSVHIIKCFTISFNFFRCIFSILQFTPLYKFLFFIYIRFTFRVFRFIRLRFIRFRFYIREVYENSFNRFRFIGNCFKDRLTNGYINNNLRGLLNLWLCDFGFFNLWLCDSWFLVDWGQNWGVNFTK